MKTRLSALHFALLFLSLPAPVSAVELQQPIANSGEKLQFQQSPPQKNAPMNKSPGKDEYLPVCGQSCAFDLAGQAMSTLGQYLQNSGAFSNSKRREEAAANIKACLQNPNGGACDKNFFRMTLVQYGFLRDIRSMVLDNQTKEEGMKTSPTTGPQKKRSVLTATGREPWLRGRIPNDLQKDQRVTFKFRIDENFGRGDVDQLQAARAANEREILGQTFLQDYKTFVKIYSAPITEDKFTTSTPMPKNDWQKQVATGVDRAKYLSLEQQMKSPALRQLTEGFNRDAEKRTIDLQYDPKRKGYAVDAKQLQQLQKDTGLGLLSVNKDLVATTPDIAKAMAESMNKQVEENIVKEKKEAARMGRPERLVKVVLDVNEFDQFLDEIWPPTLKK